MARPRAERQPATHLVTQHALRFIGRHRDRPFFFYLPHHAPHYPFQGPDDPADRTVGGEFDPRGSVADRRRAYRAMVQEMDAGIGDALDALAAHGIADRTLVSSVNHHRELTDSRRSSVRWPRAPISSC